MTGSTKPAPATIRQPSVLVIGAQKSATSWLYECLSEHPALYLPRHKREVQYLANPRYATEGMDAYWSLFADAALDATIVDVSVEYLADGAAPALVERHLTAPRFVVALRNPVDRAVSAYQWYVRKGGAAPRSLDDAFRAMLATADDPAPPGDDANADAAMFRDIRWRSSYAAQLAPWFERFGKDRFLVVLYDEIEARPAHVLARVFAFCGVDAGFRPPSIARRPKANPQFRLTTMLERLVPTRPGERISFARRVLRQLIVRFNEMLVRAGLQKAPPMDPRVRARLANVFASDVAALQRLLEGVDVVGRERVAHLDRAWR